MNSYKRSPLPWVKSVHSQNVIDANCIEVCGYVESQNVDYIIKTANAYPNLIAAVKDLVDKAPQARDCNLGQWLTFVLALDDAQTLIESLENGT